MGGRGGGSSVRSPIVVAQQTIAEANALADMDIRDAYDDVLNITGQQSRYVALQRLRVALSTRGWSRERQDEQLRRFVRERKGILIPESNQKVLPQSWRDAALRVGNEEKHLILIKD